MLPAKRRHAILEHILASGGADTESLAKLFGVSSMTIRRDLRLLEQNQHLRLTHGGALAAGFLPFDLAYGEKSAARLAAKQAIARSALEYLREDSCIILDAGTTTLELAKLILSRRLSVITNDLQIALLLSSSASLCVHATGGRLDKASKALIGPESVAFLRGVRAELAFIGTNVWSAGHGVTTASLDKRQVKNQMMRSAKRSLLLADSSKYGRFSPWLVSELADFTGIISDSELGTAAREQCQACGARLNLAQL